MANHSDSHSSETDQEKKFWIFAKPNYIDWHLHANLWVKIPNTHHVKICLFDTSKNLKNRHLTAQQTTNWWDIQKSKLGYLEHPRLHL